MKDLKYYEAMYGGNCTLILRSGQTYILKDINKSAFDKNLIHTGTIKDCERYDIMKIISPRNKVVYNRSDSLVVELL